MTEVTAISPETKTVHTGIGDMKYDYLVLAQGATTNYYHNSQLQKNVYSMKSAFRGIIASEHLIVKSMSQGLNAENEEYL